VRTLADIAVTNSPSTPEVSPVGGIVLYFVTVSNNGPSVSNVTLTDSSTGGAVLKLAYSTIPSGCTAPADGTSNPTITCSFAAMASGASKSLTVGLQTPASTATITNTATATVPSTVTDPNTSNNSQQITTQDLNDPNFSQSFVPLSQKLAYQLNTLTNSNAKNGVIASLYTAQANGALCGTAPCTNGLGVNFNTNTTYQGGVSVFIDLGAGNPCRGVGSGSTCWYLFMRKNGTIKQVPLCSSQPNADPCISSLNKNSPDITWTVKMTSTDPEFLPPLPTSGNSV
jgi:hypothetical protein